MNTLEIRTTNLDVPRKGVDGETHNHRVSILRSETGEVISTGRGFEHKKDAEIWADGVRVGLQTAALASRVTLYLVRQPLGFLDGAYAVSLQKPVAQDGVWVGPVLGDVLSTTVLSDVRVAAGILEIEPGTCVNLSTGETFRL